MGRLYEERGSKNQECWHRWSYQKNVNRRRGGVEVKQMKAEKWEKLDQGSNPGWNADKTSKLREGEGSLQNDAGKDGVQRCI